MWIVLVIVALGVMYLAVRSLWRKAKILLRELSTATERLSAVTAELQTLTGAPASAEQAAIFSDPATMRQQLKNARRRGSAGRSKGLLRRR